MSLLCAALDDDVGVDGDQAKDQSITTLGIFDP